MGTDRRPPSAARSVIGLGHLVVGGTALAFAGVMIVAGRAPNAELDGVLLGLGLLLALAATVFTCTAFLVLRRAHEGRGGGLLSLILSLVELVIGAAMAAALAIAVEGYGAFEPWRSPLLLPSALLVALGLAGLGLEVVARRSSEMH
jgi:drug/metabolite transporter (DMT)-like permease